MITFDALQILFSILTHPPPNKPRAENQHFTQVTHSAFRHLAYISGVVGRSGIAESVPQSRV